MAAHARLKNEFTEDEKYYNLMTWLKCLFSSFLDHYTASSVGWDPVPAKDLNSILNQTTDFTDQELPEMEVSNEDLD